MAASLLPDSILCIFSSPLSFIFSSVPFLLTYLSCSPSQIFILIISYLYLIISYLYLGIILKRMYIDIYIWRSLFACVRADLCILLLPVCLVPLRIIWAVSSTSRSFEKKMGFDIFWPFIIVDFKIYVAGVRNFNLSL